MAFDSWRSEACLNWRKFDSSIPETSGLFRFNNFTPNNSTGIRAPFSFLISVSAVIAVLPWLPRRFSLRTLLIATTLVAVGLGLILWASR